MCYQKKVIALITVFVFLLAPFHAAAKNKEKPRVSATRFMGQFFLGAVGNLAGGYVGGVIGYEIDKADDDGGWFEGLGGAMLGYAAGSAIGTAAGVSVIGNTGEVKGKFGKALMGALLGELVAILIAAAGEEGGWALASFLVLPPLGSTLFFNSSLKYRNPTVSNALLNFNKNGLKMGVPWVHVQPLPGFDRHHKPTLKVRVNLLSIEL